MLKISYYKIIYLLIFIFFFFCSMSLFFFFSIQWHNFYFFFNWFNLFNMNYSIAMDSLSLFFLLLTTFLFFMCLLVSWNSINYNYIEFLLILLMTEFFMLNFFLVIDLFLFFFFFECILMPMYLLMGMWGSNLSKIYASYQLFFFTLFGSIFMFFAILIMYKYYGTLDFLLMQMYNNKIMDFMKLLNFTFFFMAFSMKVPMVPFHFWLPEAHVEAPTSGSIILAGLLLKLGTYGLISFLIPLYNNMMIFLNPILLTMCIYSMIYVSFMMLSQLDLKSMIAYSSIIHMNFMLLGMLVLNKNALLGAMFLLLSHGMVSSALFICIGFIYERYHNSMILYYKGLCVMMPIFSFFYFIFILANASLPGTSNFSGEFMTLMGIFEFNKFLILLLLLGLFYSAMVNFWMYNKMTFGDLNKSFIKFSKDVSSSEFFILFIFLFLCLLLGYYPMMIFGYLKYYVLLLLMF